MESHVKCVKEPEVTAVECHVVKVERVKVNLESVVKTDPRPLGKVFATDRKVTE